MQSPQRTAGRAVAVLLPVLVILASAGPASAEPPSTWQNSGTLSGMDVLLIFIGIPLLLFASIALFGWLTHTSKALAYPIRRERDGGVALAAAHGDGEERALEESPDGASRTAGA